MSKIISKHNFIERLKFYLSFYFNDDDTNNILKDYEEWFENETSQGKSEKEVCLALEPPQKIAKNIFTESSSNSIRVSVLLQNKMVQVFLLLMIYFFASLLLSRTCNKYGYSYLYFALSINFLYFIIGTIMIKKSDHTKLYTFKNNLPITGLAVLIILFEIFFVPRLDHPKSGIIVGYLLSLFLLTLFLSSIYLVAKYILNDKQTTFLKLLHISGIITLLLYLKNQQHMFYLNDFSTYLNLLYSSISIYVETVILCCIFYMLKIGGRK